MRTQSFADPARLLLYPRHVWRVALACFALACLALVRPHRAEAQLVPQAPVALQVIAGVVRDSMGNGVPNASVTIRGASLPTPLGAQTNGRGEFSVSVPSGGTYTVSVRILGYAAQQTSVVLGTDVSRILEIELGGAVSSRLAAAPNLPLLQPFADAANWVLHTDLIYRVGNTRDSIVVPAGFVTDFASIPKELQSVFSALGPYLVAGIVHDYLYWEQGPNGCSRAEADGIFRLVMIENNASFFEYQAMYTVVNLAGLGSWNGNHANRQAGLLRELPVNRRTIKALTRWPEYRTALHAQGLRPAPARTISRAFCAHGTRDPRSVLFRKPQTNR